MGNSKLFLNGINIGSVKLGTSDVILYLGEELVYPLGSRVSITYDAATYNGTLQTAQNIVVTDESGNTLVENTDYVVTQNNGGTNAGRYPIVIAMMGQYEGTSRTSFVIDKVTPTVSAPTVISGLVYNSSQQALINPGSTDYGTLKYSIDGTDYSATIPSGTTAGTYTVYYKVDGDSNVNDVAAQSVACSINEKQVTATVELSQSTYTYNGSACEPTVTVKDGSTVIDPSEYTVTYSNNVNTGTATVTISDNVGGNYEVIGSATFTINRANVTYVAPTAVSSLVYDGNAQELLNAGTVTGGTMKYSSDDVNWGTDVPSGTNANSYTSYWKIDGDANHNDMASSSIVTTIAKADSSLSFAVTELTVNTGGTKTNTVTVNSGDGVVTYVSNDTSIVTVDNSGVISGVGIGDAIITANISQTTNYNSASTSYSVHSMIVLIGVFNVTDTSTPTRIASGTRNFSKIEIDDVEQQSVTTGYTFNTTGEHTVKYYLSGTSIGDRAFENCSGLTSISIPDGVTSIGAGVFSKCNSLTSIDIPSGVTSIGNTAFFECISLTSIDIPNSVTSIGNETFAYCSGLTSCTIGNSVTRIGYNAFYNCYSLTSVNIPDSVTSIGDSAFEKCSGLTSINIPSGVTRIGYGVFNSCRGLTSIDIPDSVTSIGDSAFGSCSGIISIDIPDNVTRVGVGTFRNCSGLTSCTIGSGVTIISESLFSECINLKRLNSNVDGVFNIPNTITKIDGRTFVSGSFYGCYSARSIVIPDSVTSIGNETFENCRGLTSCTIGSGVTRIGNWAFHECSGLTSIVSNAITPPTLGDNALRSTNNCPIYVPCDSVDAYKAATNWSAYASRIKGDCWDIIAKFNVTDTSNPTKILSIVTSVTSVYIDGVEQPSVTTGYTFNTTGEHIVGYDLYFKQELGSNIFNGCNRLTSVTIPNSVTSIGDYAFYNCSSLTSINIPSGVTSINERTFYNCQSLTSITIPDSVTSIENYAFYNCSNATDLIIGNGVITIWNNVFESCRSLTSCTIGSNVAEIGNNAFKSCSGITSVNIPDSVTYIGQEAFCDCRSLSSCTIGSGVTTIGARSFEDCTSLTSINIPSGVTSINERTFYNCESLTSIDIPTGVTSIGDDAFYECSSLTSIVIPDSVTSIGGGAFEYCRSLTSIYIPNSVTSIGNGVFNYCSSLTSIVIPDSVTSIGELAFSNCSGFTSVGPIGSGASVEIPNGVTTINSYTFFGCWGLTSVTIPSGVTFIGVSAFEGCSSLTSITIPSGVKIIDRSAFINCTSLTSIVSNAITAPTISNTTYQNVKTGGTLTVPSGNSGYDVWMGRDNYYLGKYNWTKVEQ